MTNCILPSTVDGRKKKKTTVEQLLIFWYYIHVKRQISLFFESLCDEAAAVAAAALGFFSGRSVIHSAGTPANIDVVPTLTNEEDTNRAEELGGTYIY